MYRDKEEIGAQREREQEDMLWTEFECRHHHGELEYLPGTGQKEKA